MRLDKLIREIQKDNVQNNEIFVVNPDQIHLKFIIDRINGKKYFVTMDGTEVNLLDFVNSDFELLDNIIKKNNTSRDAWDDFDKKCNPELYDDRGNDLYNDKVFYMRGNNKKNKVGGMFNPSVFKKDKKYKLIGFDFYNFKNFIFKHKKNNNFYDTANTYYNAVEVLLKEYENSNTKLGSFGDIGKNEVSFGYQEDSLIRTLLAFSCECYLKELLIQQGIELRNIPHSHGLISLYTELESDIISNIFINIEQNGYVKNKPQFSFDEEENLYLIEKFMKEFGLVNNAFIESRYCAEKDKNTNYRFLYFFALALKNECEEIYKKKEEIVQKNK